MFSFKIRHMPPDPSTLRLPEPPSPMPQQTESIEQTMAQTAISAGSPDESPLQPPQSGFVPAPLAAQNSGTGDKAEEYRKWNERGREWLYGYVWFEQRKDGGIARGYMQVSPSRSPSVQILILTVYSTRNHWSSSLICHFRPCLLASSRRSHLSFSSTAIRPLKPHVTLLHPGKSPALLPYSLAPQHLVLHDRDRKLI